MTGLFHTTANGQPVEFVVAGVRCTKISLGEMDNNSYLLDPGDGPLVLIDAPTQADRLLNLLGDRQLRAVVITHEHEDHVQALTDVASRTGATTYAGSPDADSIERQTGVACLPLWTGDQVECDGVRLGVIGLVGHTPGSIALVLDGAGCPTHIFTGDSLFPGGVGWTESPAHFASLLGDVTREIFDRFSDDTVIHPGHGDSTTLGAERPHLDEWLERGW